jgi:hypothetical protein
MNHSSVPVTDCILLAVSKLVDDAQSERREPSHSDLRFTIEKHGLSAGDPAAQGQSVGKAKRVRSVLSWALEHAPDTGGRFLSALIASIRSCGGFREGSPNFVGAEAYRNAAVAFAVEGYELSSDGELRPRLLDNLTPLELPDALNAHVRRAKRGVVDAALVTGTGKDLLEAAAAHVLQRQYGCYSTTSNFPTLLGQTFNALRLATPEDPVIHGEPPQRRIERALYEVACGINQLRNKEGTGHGRPWISNLTDTEARIATELMGIITELLLSRHQGTN